VTIGQNIRRFREEAGVSLSELAERAGVSKGYVSALENEDAEIKKMRPSGQSVYKLAEALGVTVGDLLGEHTHLDEPVDVPGSLREFAEQEGLPESDVMMLARIEFRGEQPKTVDAWGFLYRAIKYSASQ
jgi:transcriptional regulator with XRE-family HTH domain